MATSLPAFVFDRIYGERGNEGDSLAVRPFAQEGA
jgi:hypothetical protein